MNKICILMIAIFAFVACDTNQRAEFNGIDRNDIAGYETFIEKYPTSDLVDDAQQRIVVAKENLKLKELHDIQVQLERQYGNCSLPNGSQPYSIWYGKNHYIDDYTSHSEIQIKAPYNSDVIAIVRYNNHNGKVAGHKYIQAGCASTIYLQNGCSYQTFFYYGVGWNPEKEMKNGLRGGFVKNESYSKDGTSQFLDNNILKYELVLQEHGNFQTMRSNENEIF